jgi:hypothetical protein
MRRSAFITLVVIVTVLVACPFQNASAKPDFYAYNTDGSVKIRGVYITDAKGRVTKYTVYDASGALQYTEIPYYADDGRIVRADQVAADGKLQKTVVYFDTFAKVLDPEGKVIDTQDFSQAEFLRAEK